MSWTTLFKKEIKHTYKTTDSLLNFVNDETLGLKPSTENNWMTLAQHIMHIIIFCTPLMREVVTRDFRLSDSRDYSELTTEERLQIACNRICH